MINNEVSQNRYMMKPGFLILYKKELFVYGVLGSGLFVSLWDEKKGYSGCCSFLYPKSTTSHQYTVKYGDIALKHLIRSMLNEGSNRSDLKAHVIGGGVHRQNDFGHRNEKTALEILSEESIEVLSRDTGGHLGRKFIYNTRTGEHITMKVHRIRQQDWYPYH